MTFVGATARIRGVVQGVGFRYWCLHLARDYGLNGYVSNMPDGSVEMKVEGDRGVVNDFLKEVRVGPTYAHVSDLKVDWYDTPQGFDDFIIRHGEY